MQFFSISSFSSSVITGYPGAEPSCKSSRISLVGNEQRIFRAPMWINVINAKLPAREKSTSDNFSHTVQMYHFCTGDMSPYRLQRSQSEMAFSGKLSASYTAIGDDVAEEVLLPPAFFFFFSIRFPLAVLICSKLVACAPVFLPPIPVV